MSIAENEVAVAAAKVAPPVAVVAAETATHISLNEWVAIATLLYVCAQFGVLLRNEYRAWKASRRTGSK